jgi:GGDEF domain-containing protein
LISPRGLIEVTMSGGVAMLDERGLDHALGIADLALYQAKSAGRNQLAIAA